MGRMGKQMPSLKSEEIIGKKKVERRETHVHRAQKKMIQKRRERSEKKEVGLGKYRVVQIKSKKDGKSRERFFLVKRRRASKTAKLGEPEEIFKEWLKNLEAPQAPKKGSLKKRTRKMSHRCQRKRMLKEKESVGTMRYADVVKKHLKIEDAEVEDIFEAWRANLEVKEAAPAQIKRRSVALDAADIFKVWRHNLKAERVYNKRSRKGKKAISEEDIMASALVWQKELRLADGNDAVTVKPSERMMRKALKPEEIFAAWRKLYLDEVKEEKHNFANILELEDLFWDWISGDAVPSGYYVKSTPPTTPTRNNNQNKSGRNNKKNRRNGNNKRRR